ncbi:MAG: hypothetical protein H7Z38_04930 [Rubrivivax sp.]|nr:hypothetical protein [Pyrinomonadaceae bacterium]
MKESLYLLEGPETIIAAVAAPLPLSATANDLRGVVQYLRKRPEGATLGEAVDAIKKQVFEPDKINAYEALGIICKSRDRLKLDDLGWELARKLEPEAHVFRIMLSRIEPYRAALDWAQGRRLDYIIQTDIAAYWGEHFPEALGINTPRMIESNAICFFHLCQAAGLGTHIIGKKGQPTRLRLDRDELLDFNTADWGGVAEQSREQFSSGWAESRRRKLTALEGGGRTGQPLPRGDGKFRVLVSIGEAGETTRRIEETFGLAGIECHFVERSVAHAAPLPSGEAMRRCDAAVIIVVKDESEEEDAEALSTWETLQIEIGVAQVLFEHRVVLLWDERLEVPFNLHGLRPDMLQESGLTWEACVHLAKLVKSFEGTSPTGAE